MKKIILLLVSLTVSTFTEHIESDDSIENESPQEEKVETDEKLENTAKSTLSWY